MEQQVSIKSDVMLKGTMMFPDSGENQLPAILFLAGSGNINRDGSTVKGKFKFNLYKDLADIMTPLGFVTLRYDKRGVGESEGSLLKTGLWDAVTDAENALEFLANHPRVDSNRIIVLGHSEGCIVGTALNERRPVNGLILLSGGGGGLQESLDAQRQQVYKEMGNTKGFKGFLIKKLNTIEKSEKQAQGLYRKMTSTSKDIIKYAGFVKMPAKYFREHFNYDIVEGLKKISCPVLAMNGLKDFQTSNEFLERIPENAMGPVSIFLIENMDHGLKVQLTPISALNAKKDYVKTVGKPIHEEAISHLTTWLNKWKESMDNIQSEMI
ncbi:alpha/beta hydrolase [Lederbergia wuyishanensis]|uniref:Pimeloyl-ACP methyl ester carboxylesterase n=1 Tax=Lederbergia wuyishanensis TaxID=1347903 RepID=A0ABU0D867_9BACI|nr:alpha/beta fold hydrolase [Lederbergia wuyishanensis]MCJ8009288.1 alpha/beta hydrolase [Lederbergia wuyishanensis]MDQ0344578.1 pimeloyl-ACP methyl ester carboxylesterase [Lederbergia wuyishanensis]